MARKAVPRSLPALATLYPGFRGLSSQEHLGEAITKMLRRAIAQVRAPQARTFYSVRAAAAFFGVCPDTVATIYGRLETEGLLIRIRGSQTLVTGRNVQPSRPVRGVVGMPIWAPGVCYFYDWHFFERLEREVRRRGFVADLIMFSPAESVDPALADRILAHQPDYLLWYGVQVHQRQIVQAVKDAGVRVLVVGDSRLASWPETRYVISSTKALGDCVTTWKRNGIHNIDIAQPDGDPLCLTQAGMQAAFVAAGFQCTASQPAGRLLREYVRHLGRRADAVAFDDTLWFSQLCRQEPQEIVALLRRRVVLAHGNTFLSPQQLRGSRVDLLHFDRESLAGPLAQMVSDGRLTTPRRPTVIQREFLSRADAAQYAAEF